MKEEELICRCVNSTANPDGSLTLEIETNDIFDMWFEKMTGNPATQEHLQEWMITTLKNYLTKEEERIARQTESFFEGVESKEVKALKKKISLLKASVSSVLKENVALTEENAALLSDNQRLDVSLGYMTQQKEYYASLVDDYKERLRRANRSFFRNLFSDFIK